MRKKVPKYVQALIRKRTILSRQLRVVCCKIDDYCKKIGLDYSHPLFDEAVLCSDVRIYCEEDAGEKNTLEAIEKVLNDRGEKQRCS